MSEITIPWKRDFVVCDTCGHAVSVDQVDLPKLSEEVDMLDIVWSDDDIAKLTAERDKVVGLLKNFRDDYDCDLDAHTHGTECRCCAAAKMLDELFNKGTS